MMNIFDSHAHYDSKQFKDDLDDVMQSLGGAGVKKVMNVAADMKSCRTSIELAEKYAFVYCSVGVHPHDATEINPQSLAEIEALSKHNKVKAIGEIGLDYYYDYSPRDIQQIAFKQQLELAKDIVLPVIIHSRDAVEDTMNILNYYQPKGIVHCFSGSAETAKQVLKLGMYIGITGVVTFKNARKLHEVIEVTPMDKMLIETDCPYMAPEPFRGKRCDSTMLVQVIEKIADLKRLTPQEVADITYRNACEIYGIA